MFRALLAHRQEALHKRHLVYCMRVTSVVETLNSYKSVSRWSDTDIL
jgi:hypothetical protein